METKRQARTWLAAMVVVLATVGALTSIAGAASGPTTDIVGTVRESHGDDFAAGHEVDEHIALDTDSGPVAVSLPPGAAALAPGQRVRLHGHFEGQTFFVAANGETSTTGGVTPAVTGTKSVAVILLNFSNDTSQPWTTATVNGVVFNNANSVNAYYQDSSDGQLSLAGDTFGWYTIGSDNSGCQYSTWATQARNAATAAGVNLSLYQYTVYAFPSASSCGWAGLAYLPGTASFINGSMTLRVVAHELGHNLGVHHASSESCTNASNVRVTLSSTCTSSEYGDPFSVMGSASTRLHHNWHRAQLGFTNAGQTITTSGNYLLAPADSGGTPRLLRIARSDGTYFQFEFRQPTGIFDNFSVSDPAVNGVTIRIAPNPTTIVQSQLLDATPDTSTFSDAPLAVGRTFTDPFTGMQVTTTAVSGSGATVNVQFAPDTQAPTVPTNLTATAKSSSSIALAWTASTDNVGVAGYKILRGGTQITTTTATSFTDTGLSPGTAYSYQVIAYDAANLTSTPAQAGATTFTNDTQPPSAPTNLTASVSKSTGVKLTWTASTDNVGVTGYRVLRNGVQVVAVAGTSATDKPRKGTYTYTVVAYDGAGLVSSASNAVTVKV
jgi:chitodextrinase